LNEAELRNAFGNELVDALLAQIASGNTPELDPQLFATALKFDETKVSAFLVVAAKGGLVERREKLHCPNCNELLSEEAAAEELCTYCREAFGDHGGVRHRIVYRFDTSGSRDIPWLIAIHGFNTLGPWQQEFSWRVATKLKYSAPVLIYKYGLIRFSVLARWRHRALARQLGNAIRKAMAHAEANRIAEPPDVVLHSFGSQLFVQLLALPEFDDLRFGRVIVAGSVIRPDYNWTQRIDQRRVEAVFNHCGGKDMAVPFAQFFIPGTGPGARHGFIDPATVSVMNCDYHHSSCFRIAELESNLAEGGLWDRFLRGSLAPPAFEAERFRPKAWRPIWPSIRGIVRLIGVALLALIATGTSTFGAAVWLKLLACLGWKVIG
jgi:hypothetical protein